MVNTYLEDEQQMDQVYRYLNELYTRAAATTSDLLKLKFIDLVSYILDVLLPEVSLGFYGSDRRDQRRSRRNAAVFFRPSSLPSLEWTTSHFRRQRRSS